MKTGIKEIDDYCEAVQSGKLNVCRYVRLAVDRHYRDLANSDLVFDKAKAEDFFFFCQNCPHYEGKWASKPILLEPWQKFVFGSLFGWYHVSGKRRYREAIIEIPKKNGKTIISSVIALYLTMYDDEPGAQVYGAATNRSHAIKLSFRAATQMIKHSPHLQEYAKVKLGNGNERIEFGSSFFEPITSRPSSLDGFNVHGAIFDEVKDWETDEIYNVIKNGTISREKPMVINITTAGSNQESLGYQLRDMGIKILEEVMTVEDTFCIVYTLDDEDMEKWDTVTAWEKANPNYGISVNPDYFEQQVNKARESQGKKNDFLTKHLNVWISSSSAWMDMDLWKRTTVKDAPKPDKLKGMPGLMAVDLASVSDMCSVYMMVSANGKMHTFGMNYLPESVFKGKTLKYQMLYRAWEAEGRLTITPGEYTDYDFIYEQIIQYCKTYRVRAVGFDPYQAAEMMSKLDRKGLKVIEIRPTVMNLSQPMQDVEHYAGRKLLEHYNDPVLKWAVNNVMAKYDNKGNIFPSRDNRQKKIDAAICLIMLFALHRQIPLNSRKKSRRKVI